MLQPNSFEKLLEDAGRFERNHDAKGLVVLVDESRKPVWETARVF